MRRSRSGLAAARSELFDQRSDVDNENDLSLPDLGRTGHAGNGFEPLANRFDDDLLLPHQSIDKQSRDFVAGTGDDNEPLAIVACAVLQLEDIAEAEQRNRRVA
jgi:hypothetical protein